MRKLLGDARAGNAIALVALFVALGGTAFAAATITSRDVKNNSLTSSDIRNNSLRGGDIRNSSLTSSDVRNGSLLAADFRAGQLPTGAKGDKGDKGDAGPSNVRAASFDGPPFLTLTGTTPATANTVVTLADVPAGNHLVHAVLQINKGLDSARVICQATIGTSVGEGIVTAGGAAGAQSQTMLPILLTTTTNAAGPARLACWMENLVGAAPFIGAARMTVTTVGTLQAVAGIG